MRIIAIVLGNLAALALLLGAAGLFLTQFRQVSDKDIGLTDSEINQIIEQRRAAVAGPAPVAGSAPVAVSAPLVPAPNAAAPEGKDESRETTAVADRAAPSSAEAVRAIDRKAVLAAAEKRPRKRPQNIAVPDQSRLTPWGFGPLPVFTTFTLLGLRP